MTFKNLYFKNKKAGAAHDAIEMHIGRGDWIAAEQLAEHHDPEALTRILVIIIEHLCLSEFSL